MVYQIRFISFSGYCICNILVSNSFFTMDEFGEPLFECALHPSQIIVGICSSCLRERLLDLISRTDEENRRGIIYIPDECSWGYITCEKGSNNGDTYSAHAVGTRDVHPTANSARSAVSQLVGPSKNVELPRRTKSKDNERKRYSGLRSFFLRLEGLIGFKRDNKPADKILSRRGNEAALQDRYESPRGYTVEYDSTVRAEVWLGGCRMPGGDPRHGKSSVRQSFSERRSMGAARSCNGFSLQRSISDVSEEGPLGGQETSAKKSSSELARGWKRCSNPKPDGKYLSHFFTSISCRNQAQADVWHTHSGARGSAGKASGHGLMGECPQEEGRKLQHAGAEDILPRAEVWSSLNQNQARFKTDRGHRRETGTDNEGWVRALNRPKRRFPESRSRSARHEGLDEIFGGYKIALSP